MKTFNTREFFFHSANYMVYTVFMLFCIYPFYYIFINSISSPDAIISGVYFWPKELTFDTYRQLFQSDNILNAFFVSASRAVIGTFITVLACSFFSFLITKREMFARKFVYRFVIITMYLNAGLIPWYITMRGLGLKDNYLLYILPGIISAYFVILIKTYMESLPPVLEESAMIDGAGYLRIFSSIILPVCMPILATVAVFNAVNQWNSWTDNYFLVSNPKLQTLQLILLNYLRQAESMASDANRQLITSSAGITGFKVSSASVRLAITMIVTLPIMLVYPFMQRYFVKGIMMGAVKG
ncbi:ABC transporter permease [Bacillus sp. FJAT-27264]|uniref:carbohydrate ABC transporter permease n=1 Tax=Paenibacillus sp. (strain DSM 101736 / FJAT-27264) TaxID=1850362 RepID=UPI000808157D|nr:carbohydrate ABC transporter permease [Bacillus sp. FJAT-27264]OBZ18028.1 ABC transporter permease [Bacillus sp. FJAT-27264]